MAFVRGALAAMLVLASSTPLFASPLTLRFTGTTDLSLFGGAPDATFRGTLTWDTVTEPQVVGTDWVRYLLDGDANSMRATFELNSVDYSSRVQPYSRVELTASEFFVQLFFVPQIVLSVREPPIDNIALELSTTGAPVLFDLQTPPQDLTFLSLLPQRRLAFLGQDWWGGPYVIATSLVVPEPGGSVLLLLGGAAVVRQRYGGRR